MRFSEKFFMTFFLLFFFVGVFFLGMAREKRGGREGQAENTWSVKYKSVELCCPQSHRKLKRFQVKL